MTNALNQIKRILSELAADTDVPMNGVYYGQCTEKSLKHWNYVVFNRYKTTKSSNRKDWQTYYNIHIIHEDFIPEGYVDKVVRTLESDDEVTIRTTPDDVVYNYTTKSGTDLVVEIATITVFVPEKRG